jgi:hypothetical protein
MPASNCKETNQWLRIPVNASQPQSIKKTKNCRSKGLFLGRLSSVCHPEQSSRESGQRCPIYHSRIGFGVKPAHNNSQPAPSTCWLDVRRGCLPVFGDGYHYGQQSLGPTTKQLEWPGHRRCHPNRTYFVTTWRSLTGFPQITTNGTGRSFCDANHLALQNVQVSARIGPFAVRQYS